MTEVSQVRRFVSATNGLFCAHRLHDEESALRYMTVAAASIDNPLTDVDAVVDSSNAAGLFSRPAGHRRVVRRHR